MLDPMVATAGVDLIIAIVWVGGVTLLLLGRALISWRRFRHNSNFALQARRLSDATRPMPGDPRTGPASAEVIPIQPRPKPAAGSQPRGCPVALPIEKARGPAAPPPPR